MRATRSIAGDLLRALIKAVPYTIHTVLTDNGTHFTSPGNNCFASAELRRAMDCGELFRAHALEYACVAYPAGMVMTVPGELLVCARARRMFTIVNATLLSKSVS